MKSWALYFNIWIPQSNPNFSLTDRCLMTSNPGPIPICSPLLPWRWQVMVARLCCRCLSLSSSFYRCLDLASGPTSKRCSCAMASSPVIHWGISRKEKPFTLSFCSTHLPEQRFLQHYLKALFLPWIGVLVVPGLKPGKCSTTEPSQCFSHTEHSRCQFSVLSK